VSSRHELVARMFLEGYLPQIARNTPLSASGGFTG
jgi:hypothetical protein